VLTLAGCAPRAEGSKGPVERVAGWTALAERPAEVAARPDVRPEGAGCAEIPPEIRAEAARYDAETARVAEAGAAERRLTLSDANRRAALRRLMDLYERCRGGR
jgi:hypothetical protein